MTHVDGSTIFAGWILLLEIASKCTPRGSLIRGNGLPHNVTTLSAKCHCPARWFELAISYLEANTDWIEVEMVMPERQDTAIQTSGWCQSGDEERKKGIERTEADSPGAEHQAFIKGWTENFKAAFGFDYHFVPRDAKAVQGLLRTGILRIDLLEIAKSAWKRGSDDKFASACKRTSTIWEYKDSLNQVQVELKRKYENHGASGSKGFDRNKGTLNAGHAERYDLKKIQEERALRDAAKPTLGENA